jgi:hypothetical protein
LRQSQELRNHFDGLGFELFDNLSQRLGRDATAGTRSWRANVFSASGWGRSGAVADDLEAADGK